MTVPLRSAFRDALSVLSLRLILAQLGLALGLFLLFCLWLHIPDGSVLDLLATVTLAVLIIGLAGAGESSLLLHFAGEPRSRSRLFRGTVLLLVATISYFSVSALIDHLRSYDPLWAGVWNSDAPRTFRGILSYEHIYSWLDILWSSLTWIVAGAVAGALLVTVPAKGAMRAISYLFRSASFWLVMLAGAPFTVWVANALTSWAPGKALSVEMVSLALRLLVATLLASWVATLWLAILAACARRTNLLYGTPDGTPVVSHPRTADAP